MKSTSSCSRIVLLDIDGTIIGNVVPIICEWELMLQIGDKAKMTKFRQNLHEVLVSGLLRPGLADFIDAMKRQIETEFFIYTASNTKWANYLIPVIEGIIGHKFQRPIFTRNHCLISTSTNSVIIRKSLVKISNIVWRRIKTMYPHATITDVRNNIALVDNSLVLVPNEKKRMILCPTYHAMPVVDVLKNIDNSRLRNDYKNIMNTLIVHGMFPDSKLNKSQSMTFDRFLSYYYTYLGYLYKKNDKYSELFSHDSFWPVLATLFEKHANPDIKETSIKYINQQLSSTYK